MSEFKQLSGPEGIAKIGELIEGIHIAILTTVAPDGTLDSRPMAPQGAKFDGTVYFLTRHESGKVHEIEQDAHVGVIYADPSNHNYVSMKGRATVNQDKAKIHELWNPMFTAWFPDGENDPQIAVLKIEISEANYWEASSSKLVYGIKYLAASLTGGSVDVSDAGKVTL